MTEDNNRINELKFVDMACIALASKENPDPFSVLQVRDRAVNILTYFEDRPHIVLCDDGKEWLRHIKIFLTSFTIKSI